MASQGEGQCQGHERQWAASRVSGGGDIKAMAKVDVEGGVPVGAPPGRGLSEARTVPDTTAADQYVVVK